MFDLPLLGESNKYDHIEVGLTAKELIYEENKLKFYRYKPVKKKLHPVPFLIIYALINKNYILDLVPGTSFVEHLVSQGIDTYIIDWGEPGDEDRFLELDYFIEWYIHRAVKKTLEISQSESLTLFGYCMGGHLATIYSALHNELVKNLIVLASPIDTQASHLLNIWADKERLDIEKLQEAFGNIPAKIMQKIFGLIRDQMEKNYYGDIGARDAVAKWSNDHIDIPGQVFVKYVKEIFQQNLLCANKMRINGKPVQLNNIHSNLMVITGDDDWVAPYPTTTALHNLVSSKNKETVLIKGGHLGFVVQKDSRKVWDKIVAWLTETASTVSMEKGKTGVSNNSKKNQPSTYNNSELFLNNSKDNSPVDVTNLEPEKVKNKSKNKMKEKTG